MKTHIVVGRYVDGFFVPENGIEASDPLIQPEHVVLQHVLPKNYGE
jgi:hypothetical protein